MRLARDEMGLFDHLKELRSRLIRVCIVIAITIVGGLWAASPIIHYIKRSGPAAGLSLNVFSPWDAVRIYMNVAFAVALVVALPYALYQLWGFLKPGLKPGEQKASLVYIPLAAVLALAGLAFAYFVVFPFALLFSVQLSQTLELQEVYGISQFFSFMFNIVLPITVLFELPVVVMFLTRMRLLHPKHLSKFRKYAYFILFVVGAIVTPPDLLSAIIVSIPMMVLYEISVLLSRAVCRKQSKAERAVEQEWHPAGA